MDILLTAKGMLYLDMLIANAIRMWKREGKDMTEEELDQAIAVEEARKDALEKRLADH